jgi:hypothetical protein
MAVPLSTLPAHPNLRRLSCEIIVVNGRDPQSPYRATCTDPETGIVLGSRLLPAGPDGAAPAVTLGDVVELIGGGYRCASVAVEIEAENLSRQTRRIVDILRLRKRLWRRRRTTRARTKPHARSVPPALKLKGT